RGKRDHAFVPQQSQRWLPPCGGYRPVVRLRGLLRLVGLRLVRPAACRVQQQCSEEGAGSGFDRREVLRIVWAAVEMVGNLPTGVGAPQAPRTVPGGTDLIVRSGNTVLGDSSLQHLQHL